LTIGLAVHEILSNDIIGFSIETLVRNGLYFKSEVEVAQVFERDRRHADLILLGWDLDDGSVFVWLI
jgi:hypothetical protein